MTYTDSNRSSPESASGSNREDSERTENGNNNEQELEGNDIGSGNDDGDRAEEQQTPDDDGDRAEEQQTPDDDGDRAEEQQTPDDDGDLEEEQHAADDDNETSRGPVVSGTQDLTPPSCTSVSGTRLGRVAYISPFHDQTTSPPLTQLLKDPLYVLLYTVLECGHLLVRSATLIQQR
jgi:hypothetical protein